MLSLLGARSATRTRARPRKRSRCRNPVALHHTCSSSTAPGPVHRNSNCASHTEGRGVSD